MIIRFHKTFDKRYVKLSAKLQVKVDHAVSVFQQNPFHPDLENHHLSGSMKGKRAFAVTGSYRVIFEEYEKYTIVLMLDVGTHPQVYGS